jgi:osmoprotectant transport system substrate-binding protein
MKRILRGAALAAAVLLAATGCGGDTDNPVSGGSGGGASPAGGEVIVGSANFPENVLLAEMYAQALEAKGVKVTKKLDIGSREAIYKEIQSGNLSVLPEYNGALLAFLDKTSKASTTEQVNAELKTKLPAGLKLLDSAKAEDKDSIAVTKETATKYNIKGLPDLAPLAKDLVLGGPPEFKTRQQGVLGLKSVYGIEFKQFKSLDTGGPLTIAALEKGDVQAANLFSTDPSILTKGFVVLEDPKNVFGAQNVTPLVNTKAANPTVEGALNAVSAKLDTPTLADLLKKVVADKQDPDQVAGDWLKANALV